MMPYTFLTFKRSEGRCANYSSLCFHPSTFLTSPASEPRLTKYFLVQAFGMTNRSMTFHEGFGMNSVRKGMKALHLRCTYPILVSEEHTQALHPTLPPLLEAETSLAVERKRFSFHHLNKENSRREGGLFTTG